MKEELFRGVGTAIATPFTDIGTMIYRSLDDEMKVIIEKWNGEKVEV